ncbi:MAG: ComEC/Rec2 family competence protein [Deltaproteobacteria bacterium]|nr:ComEC/Rec2 family competence protein [Deltaproteobacteria bacterium]
MNLRDIVSFVEYRIPFLPLFLAVAAAYFAVSGRYIGILFLLPALLLLFHRAYLIFVSSIIVFFVCILSYHFLEKNFLNVEDMFRSKIVSLNVTVRSGIGYSRHSTHFIASTHFEGKRFNVYVALKNYEGKISPGDIFYIRGKLIPATALSYNHLQFDFRKYLLQRRVHFVVYPFYQSFIGEKKGIGTLFFRIRNRLEENIDAFCDEDVSGLLKSCVFGDRTGLKKDIKNMFVRTQTAHLTAVSGLHLGFVIMIFYPLFYLIIGHIPYFYRRYNLKLQAFLFTIPFVLLYACIVGLRIPTLRALCFILFSFLIVLNGKTKQSYNILFFIAILFSIVNPLIISSASFVLSFSMTFFAIFTYTNLQEKGYKGIKGYLLFIVIMFLFSVPLSAYYFHRLAIAGIGANLVAVPLMGFFILPFTIFSALFSLLNIYVLNKLLFFVLSAVSHLFIHLIAFFGSFSSSQLFFVPLVFIFLFYCFLVLVFKRRYKFLPVVVFVFVVCFVVLSIENNVKKIYFFDLYRGGAVLFYEGKNNVLITHNLSSWNEKIVDDFISQHHIKIYKKIDFDSQGELNTTYISLYGDKGTMFAKYKKIQLKMKPYIAEIQTPTRKFNICFGGRGNSNLSTRRCGLICVTLKPDKVKISYRLKQHLI